MQKVKFDFENKINPVWYLKIYVHCDVITFNFNFNKKKRLFTSRDLTIPNVDLFLLWQMINIKTNCGKINFRSMICLQHV